MSARPLFWPASRVAARRRVSRRGFFLVAGAHLAAMAGVVLLTAGPAKIVTAAAGRKMPPAGETDPPAPASPPEEAVVWMDPVAFEAPPLDAATPPPSELGAVPEPPAATPPPRPPAAREQPSPASTPRPVPPRSKPTPVRASKPSPRPTPAAKGRTNVRPPVPRPRLQPFAAAKPSAEHGPANRGGTDPNANAVPGTDDAPGAGGTDWYASMLHERFHARWEQPTSVFASTQRYVATLRLRIERDGRISDYRLVRSSGLVPMDESVLAAAARVGRVDPPPTGLLRGGAYVVNVGFVRE